MIYSQSGHFLVSNKKMLFINVERLQIHNYIFRKKEITMPKGQLSHYLNRKKVSTLKMFKKNIPKDIDVFYKNLM